MDVPNDEVAQQAGVVVLCVDEDVRDLLRFWIEEVGCPVAIAADGHDAATKLRHGRWRTLATDRFLPPWPGLDSILALKQLYGGLRVVVVEDGNPYTQNLARVIGADATLSRPLRRASVLSAFGIC